MCVCVFDVCYSCDLLEHLWHIQLFILQCNGCELTCGC